MITDAFRKSWEILTKNWLMLFCMAIPATIFSGAESFLSPARIIAISNPMLRAGSGIGVLILSLIGALFVASLSMGIAKSVQTGEFKFKYAFIAFTKKYNWPVIILVAILMSIAEFLGMIAFIVPGVILAVGWSLWFYVYQDQIEAGHQMGIKETFSKSWKVTKGYKWSLFGLDLIFGVMTYFVTFLAFAFISVNQVAFSIALAVAVIVMIFVTVWGRAAFFIFYEEIKKQNS